MRLLTVMSAVILFAACKKDCPTCEKCENPDSDCKVELTKGLIAHYPFNGSFNDVSGNNLHATAVNGAYLGTDYLGRSQSAAAFDGDDDYLTVTQNDKFNTDSVTVTCEVMINDVNRRNMLISKINADNTTSFIYGLGQTSDTDKAWSWAVAEQSQGCNEYAVFDRSKVAYSSTLTQAGRWYSVIATFGRDGQKIYLDGNLVGQLNRTFSSLKKCSEGNILIGGWWKNDIISLDGKMDEVRFYNRVLSSCEIAELSAKFKETAK